MFADQVGEVLEPDLFDIEYLRLFVKEIYDYKEKYKFHPSRSIMKTIIKEKYDDDSDIVNVQLKEYYRDKIEGKKPNPADLEFFKDRA